MIIVGAPAPKTAPANVFSNTSEPGGGHLCRIELDSVRCLARLRSTPVGSTRRGRLQVRAFTYW